MKLFVHGLYNGFCDKTDPVHCGFFLDLFEKVFQQSIEISHNMDECELLLESIFTGSTRLFDKEWKYTFMFHGESDQHTDFDRLSKIYPKYSCCLYGKLSHSNVINMPLYVPYLYCNNLTDKLQSKKAVLERTKPTKNICAIISKEHYGSIRHRFLERLERVVHIDYAGHYKNNVPRIEGTYNSPELFDFISQYKFIVSIENSRDETYITEKIINGFAAGIVPIYWGCDRVHDYFNADRFLCLDANTNMNEEGLNASMDAFISKIVQLLEHDDAYDAMRNANVFAKKMDLENHINIDTIVLDIRKLIFPSLE